MLTSAVTLGIAAIALLPPLDHRLRREEVASLQDTALASRGGFEDLPVHALTPGNRKLVHLADALERRTGARVAVFGAGGRELVDTGSTRVPFGPLPPTDRDARPSGHVARNSQAADVARVAVRIRVGPRRVVVALRKPLDDVKAAARDVRAAFTTAALVGLGTALLLGIGIATTLLRRLRRLRDAALGEAELPEDRSPDEVGDLGRAFTLMQSRVRREEELRRRFVSTASHELRTPLASLQGMLELLDRDLEPGREDVHDARAQAERAHDQARRLTALATDLLELTRIDSQPRLRSEPVELDEVCRAVVAEFDVRVGAASVALRHEPCEPACWAVADPGAVARAIRILVDNALRFSPPGGAVTVAVGRDAGFATVRVEDDGPGVADADRERIFERFGRGSASPGDHGFGLGLAIGRDLARLMGGDLRLLPSDSGARFELRLRAADRPAETADRAEPAAVPATS